MTVKQKVIESAFAKAAILPEEEGLSANELIRVLALMNNLVEVWYDDGITIPYLISDNLSDDTNCTAAQEEAIANSLAIEVMAIYAADRAPSPQLLAKARQSKRALRNQAAATAKKTFPSTLPRGGGNTRRYTNDVYTFYSNQQPLRVVLSNKEPLLDNFGNPLYFDATTWRNT